MDIVMFLFVFGNCCLEACRYKEVLLFQSQLFTCIVVVVRVKDFYNIAGKVLLLYCFLVITLVKGIKLEVSIGSASQIRSVFTTSLSYPVIGIS